MSAASRYSSPPCEVKLAKSTSNLSASLDVLEKRFGSEPMPAAVAIAALDLTDEQRLAAAREMADRFRKSGYTTVHPLLASYEREARDRLAAGSKR